MFAVAIAGGLFLFGGGEGSIVVGIGSTVGWSGAFGGGWNVAIVTFGHCVLD